MIGLGTLVNCAAIVAGSLAGAVLQRGFPDKWKETLMAGMGLCTLVIGLNMAQKSVHIILVVVSIALGTLLGEWLDIDGHLNRFGKWVEGKLVRWKEAAPGRHSLGDAFVSASLLFCIGAMAIIGSITDGITGDHAILFAKASLDAVMSLLLASTMGPGVALSAVPVLLYQGSITLLALWLQSFMTDAVIAELSATGGIMIMAIGLNLTGVTKLRLANMIPGIVVLLVLAAFLL